MTTDSTDTETGIVLRTRDRPAFLRRAIDDILGQTYDDYSVTVVNDAGDPAPVEEAVAAVADRAGGRFHIVHNERSDGREAAMNVGVRNSSSKYLVIHDDDDTWAPTFLESTVAHLRSTGDRAVATRAAIVWEELDGDEIVEHRCERLAPDKTQVTFAEVLRRNFVPTNSLVYERALHDEVGEYDADLPVLADWAFLVKVIAKHPVAFLDGPPQAFWHLRKNATGDAANSVGAADSDHLRFDATVRDRFLREDIARNGGLGLLLTLLDQFDRLTTTTHEQTAHVHAQVSYVERRVEDLDRSLVSRNNRLVAQLDLLHQLAETSERERRALGDQIAELHSQVIRLHNLAVTQTPKARLRRYADFVRRQIGPS